MKKNTLIILLASLALSACDLDLSFLGLGNKTNQNIEGQTQEPQQEQNSENSSGNNGDNGNGGGQVNTDEATTFTVKTYGSSISNVGTSPGVNIDSSLLSGSENANKLETALKNQLASADYLDKITCTKLNTADYESAAIIQIGTGNPANNKFTSGTFTWKAKKAKIAKVSLEVQCYTKDEGATDSSAHLSIDSSDYSLEIGESETPAFKVIEKEYSEMVDSFTLTSINGRVFMKTVTITWGKA